MVWKAVSSQEAPFVPPPGTRQKVLLAGGLPPVDACVMMWEAVSSQGAPFVAPPGTRHKVLLAQRNAYLVMSWCEVAHMRKL